MSGKILIRKKKLHFKAFDKKNEKGNVILTLPFSNLFVGSV